MATAEVTTTFAGDSVVAGGGREGDVGRGVTLADGRIEKVDALGGDLIKVAGEGGDGDKVADVAEAAAADRDACAAAFACD